jgi:phospholipase/carboxylesterase
MLETIEINPQTTATSSIIWLHGLGADGHDFVDIVPQLNLPADHKIRFIFPHAPIQPISFAAGMEMRAWFDIHALSLEGIKDEKGILQAEKLVTTLIDREIERGIVSQNIILAGFSQGAAIALQCGLSYLKPLGGILILSGFLASEKILNMEKKVANHSTPILMLHGTMDHVVPPAWADLSYSKLKELNLNVTLETFPMEHTLCEKEIEMIAAWIKKIIP